jgi:chemotaxis protein MotB
MADSKELQPIIIKKKKGGHHGGHHGGAWKVAFADFMTAMMAFFLVMWLVGQKPEVKEAVQGFFRDPGKYMREGQSGVLRGGQGAIPQNQPQLSMIESAKQAEKAPSDDGDKERMRLAAKELLTELEKQEAFQRLRENIKIEVTAEGLRIELTESTDAPAFFESGSAKLLQKSAIILQIIAGQLGKLENRVVLEGHTSESPTGFDDYTNWELSSDRANAARSLMEVSGLYDHQVREVRGLADRFPMIAYLPEDPRNRRVSIIVLYKDAENRYDEIRLAQTDASSSQVEQPVIVEPTADPSHP